MRKFASFQTEPAISTMADPYLTPHNIPTTDRKADLLAKHYGFGFVECLAESLPREAAVADVGSGVSLLGHVVATLRPDITWTNIDAKYGCGWVQEWAAKDAPENLRLMQANITRREEIECLMGKMDRVFSFWLMQHLSLEYKTPAEKAARHMFQMLNPKGELFVGPIAGIRSCVVPPKFLKDSIHLRNDRDENAAVRTLVSETRLHGYSRYFLLKFDRGRNVSYRPTAVNAGSPT